MILTFLDDPFDFAAVFQYFIVYLSRHLSRMRKAPTHPLTFFVVAIIEEEDR